MEKEVGFVGGQGTRFINDGPWVEVVRDDQPVARIPFADLLEFADGHGLVAETHNIWLFSRAGHAAVGRAK